MTSDYVVVGAGLTGAVIARLLRDAGYSVVVVERRSTIAGNVHDHVHPCGIRIHTYGPHYFRTDSDDIWEFVKRFTDFYQYEAIVKTDIGGRYENWPISGSYVKAAIGENWTPDFQGKPSNFEEASLAMMPRLIYEKFVKGYTEKQWGIAASELSTNLARRFDVRTDDDPRLVKAKYQVLPDKGYTHLIYNMLKDTPVVLNLDYLEAQEHFIFRRGLIYTGPIDEYFGFRFGRLLYRGQIRSHYYYPETAYMLPCGQVNNPDPHNGDHIRTLEWKHMMPGKYAASIRGTVLTTETPYTPTISDGYEYPFPDERNLCLYEKYRREAEKHTDILICGRLGEYKYYDMDKAIARALELGKALI